MKAKLLFLIPAVICCFLSSFSAEIQSFGVPFVQNYPKSIYHSGNQNWSIAKGPRGVMYFGNSEGLLSFDGRYWELYRLPNRQIVRAVATDERGNVYTGGFGEIGYWNYDAAGKFTYTSLVGKIPARHALNDEVWKIYADSGRVIFQSFSRIYIYEGGRIRTIETGSSLLFLHKVGDRFFVEDLEQGLFELAGDRLKKVIPRGELKGNVLSILPYKPGSYIIGTAKSGLFIFDDHGVRPWPNQANELLRKYQLNNGTVIQDRFLAFGTILNGVVILDKQGNLVQRIDKSGGLQNNTVLSLFTDDHQNLWTGLDNGIDRVDINSPLYFYLDKTGRFGTVYSSIIHGNRIYLGTNQGLYYSEWPRDKGMFKDFDFRLIDGTQGQVWNLSLIDGQLICGHNEGTFLVEGASVTRMSDAGGGWTIGPLKSHPGVLVQGTYTGLVIYKKNAAGKWQFSHRVEGFGAPSRFVEQDSRGSIWVSHAYRGLYRLVLSPDLKRVVSSKSYTSREGLPGDYQVHVFTVNNQLLFSSGKGLYVYDHVADRFTGYTSLNQSLGSFRSSGKIIRAGESSNWFIRDGKIALADFRQAGKIRVDSSTLNVLNGRMVQYYENISRISANMFLISVDDGFVIYNAARKIRIPQLPGVLIRRVENTSATPVLLAEAPGKEISVAHDRNSIRIAFSLPYYSPEETRYQYMLEGYTEGWSAWSTQSEKEFSNLPSGDYTFRVRAKVNDRMISETAVMKLTVTTPWYRSAWAFLFYGGLVIFLVWLGKKNYSDKLSAHQEQLRLKLEAEKQEQLRQEALASEREIVRLKNLQLQADLEAKNRELANSAMNIVSKNELLQKISEEIHSLKDDQGNKLPDSRLKNIQKVIEDGMNDDRDWNLFEKSFNEAHENFFKKLKVDYPELVPNDLKLCSYLRMNMSSKEIASLLNITLRGVEIRRYRLRKKLNLPQNKNLTEFLMEI